MPESFKFQNMIDRRNTIAAIDIEFPVGASAPCEDPA